MVSLTFDTIRYLTLPHRVKRLFLRGGSPFGVVCEYVNDKGFQGARDPCCRHYADEDGHDDRDDINQCRHLYIRRLEVCLCYLEEIVEALGLA